MMAAKEFASVKGGGGGGDFGVGLGEAVGDAFLGEDGFVPVLVHGNLSMLIRV